MKNSIHRFLRDERGLEAVEYAIITGFLVAAAVTAIATLGTWVTNQFVTMDTRLSTQ